MYDISGALYFIIAESIDSFRCFIHFQKLLFVALCVSFFLKEANISIDKFIHILLNNLMKISKSTVFFHNQGFYYIYFITYTLSLSCHGHLYVYNGVHLSMHKYFIITMIKALLLFCGFQR